MSKVENYGQSIEIKKQQLQSLEASVDNATKLFQNARAEYMEVLLAQRDLMEASMVLIETKQQQLAAIVNAYQALGGGAALYGPGVVVTPVEELPLQPEDGETVPPLTPPTLPADQAPKGSEMLPSPDPTAPKDPNAPNAPQGGADGNNLRVLPPA